MPVPSFVDQMIPPEVVVLSVSLNRLSQFVPLCTVIGAGSSTDSRQTGMQSPIVSIVEVVPEHDPPPQTFLKLKGLAPENNQLIDVGRGGADPVGLKISKVKPVIVHEL